MGALKERSMSVAEERQAELTASLKAWVARSAELSQERTVITGKIYIAAHEWVQIALLRKQCKTVQEAVKRLADTLRKTPGCIDNWHLRGKFMHDHDIASERAQMSAVRALYDTFGYLSKASQLRCLQLVKGGCDRKAIVKIVGTAPIVLQRRADARAASIARSGKLSRNRLRLEMRALKTLAQKFYGDDAQISVHIMKDALVEEAV